MKAGIFVVHYYIPSFKSMPGVDEWMDEWIEGRMSGYNQQLDCNLSLAEPEAPSLAVYIFLTQRNCDIMNVCYFKLLNLGILYYN